MLETLENSETQFEKLTITLKDYLDNKINGHEILLNGKMYDIKSVYYSNYMVVLYAINDSKEDGIIKKINKSIDSAKNHGGKLPIQLIKLMSFTYICPALSKISVFEFPAISVFQFLNEIPIRNFSEITTPPPQIG